MWIINEHSFAWLYTSVNDDYIDYIVKSSNENHSAG